MIRVILLVLIPSLLFGQNWIGYFEKDTDVYLNERIIKHFEDNYKRIESYRGKEKITIPFIKTFKAGDPITFIDGYPYQYKIDKDFKIVTINSLECYVYEFDLKKKEINITNKNNDNDDDIKEKDNNKLEEKIKVKHAKLKKPK